MNDYGKRSGQIPAFGDWDYANESPITRYFECARQASSSGKPKPYVLKPKQSRNHVPVRKMSRVKEKREGGCGGGGGRPLVNEEKTAGRVCDVTEPARKYQHRHRHLPVSNNINNNCSKHVGNDVVPPNRLPVTTPKPVDEDLYKIPRDPLLFQAKENARVFSCLVPACAT